MSSEATVLRLIDALYEAALEPQRWPAFLNLVSDVLGGRLVAFLHQDMARRDDDAIASLIGIDASDWRVYVEHFAALNPWIPGAGERLQPGLVTVDEEVCSVATLQRSEFFNDYLRPRSLHHMMGATVAREGTTVTNFSVQRGPDRGPFTQADRTLLRRLMPHMQRVVQIHQRLAGAERRGPLAEAADCLPSGILMTDSLGHALFVNRAADAILRASDGLTLARGGICAARSDESAALRRLLGSTAAARAEDARAAGGVLRISRPSGRRAYLVVVSPVRGPREAWLALERPAAIVFVTDPEREVVPDADLLGRVYGLTPAEIRMARLLASGDTLFDAADALGITRQTARTHLRNLLQKTDTHRQAELIAMLLRSELPAQGAGA